MDQVQDNLPHVQKRVLSLNIQSKSQSSENSDKQAKHGKTTTVSSPGGEARVRSPIKRQFSEKYLRHISFSGDSPERKHFLHRGRTGSMAGDLSPGAEHIRPTHVLLLYTGGALGWKLIPGGFKVMKNLVLNELKKLPTMHDAEYVENIKANILDDLPEEEIRDDQIIMPVSKYGVRTFVDVKEMTAEIVGHSQDMDMKGWANIALKIKEYYSCYDGFVILHGTDTLCYTASALSFMFENLGKSVIFTGSLCPINEHLTDGRDNILGALMLAGHHIIPEVSVFFHGKLYRGNRCLKVDSRSFGAFDSPNFPPIASVESGIDVEWDEIFQCNLSSKFTVRTNLVPHVGVLRLFPGITIETVKKFLQPPIQGVVLETYGAGNGPDSRQDILDELKTASQRGVIFVNCTQCLYGQVVDSYASGKVLLNAGVIPGADMTVEAALTKLSYVLGLDISYEERKRIMRSNIRGELTLESKHQAHQFSLRDNELIGRVAANLKVGSCEEVRYIKQALFPVLMCSAASMGDVNAVAELCNQAGGNPNAATDYDGRTPLHIACTEGQVEIVKCLLLRGASPHVQDKYGQRPIDDAIQAENEQIVELLCDCGAHIGPMSMDSARLLCQYAADSKVSKLKVWRLAGADLNSGDYDKRTPLHVAVCRESVDSVKFLLSCGVDVNAVDLYGQSPLQNAEAVGNEEILQLLKDAQAKKD